VVTANGFPSVEGRLVCGSVFNVLAHESKHPVKSVLFPRAKSLFRKSDVLSDIAYSESPAVLRASARVQKT